MNTRPSPHPSLKLWRTQQGYGGQAEHTEKAGTGRRTVRDAWADLCHEKHEKSQKGKGMFDFNDFDALNAFNDSPSSFCYSFFFISYKFRKLTGVLREWGSQGAK